VGQNPFEKGFRHLPKLFIKVFAGGQAPRRGVPIKVFSKRAPSTPKAAFIRLSGSDAATKKNLWPGFYNRVHAPHAAEGIIQNRRITI
jgi:hypothetical protein